MTNLFKIVLVVCGLLFINGCSASRVDINESSIEMLNKERENFEDKWNFFNKIRTGIAFLVSLMFILFTFFYF